MAIFLLKTPMKKAAGFLLLGTGFLVFGDAGYIAKFNEDSKIVFTSNFGGNNDIYLLSQNRLTKLTDDPASDEWPVPDSKGQNIVFMSNRDGNYNLYLMDLESRNIKRLTEDPRDEMSPSWSSDDQSLYFDLKIGNKKWRTIKLDLRTGTSAPLFPDPPYSSTIVPFQNKQGDEIYFTGKVLIGWVVAKFHVPSGRYTELTKPGSCRPKISPDGKKIAYVCFNDDGLGDVFMMNADGSGKVNLTKDRSKSYDYHPCFSPDGERIVFSSSPEAKAKAAYQLYVLDLKTGKSNRIFAADGNNGVPYWFR